MKIGAVKITAVGEDKWELEYYNPKRHRPTLEGLSLKQVKAVAADINRDIQLERAGLKPKNVAPSLWDGFEAAKIHSNARSRHQKNRKLDFTLFVNWLNESYPGVENWSQIRPLHIQAYIRQLEADGKSYYRIKGRIEPVRQAWRAMAQNYPDTVMVPPPVTMRGVNVQRHESDCLEPHEVADVLAWLKEHAPALHPVAALQFYAGLRMFEASCLRVSDVIEEHQAIRVTDTWGEIDGEHKVIHLLKNKPSHRDLPLADVVWEILQPWIDKARKEKREFLFIGRKGKPIMNVIVKRWRRAIKHLAATPETIKRKKTGKPLTLNPHGLSRPELARVPAHRLRSSFASMLIGTVDRELVQLYMGHSGNDTLGSHYQVAFIEKLRPVADAVKVVTSQNRHGRIEEIA